MATTGARKVDFAALNEDSDVPFAEPPPWYVEIHC